MNGERPVLFSMGWGVLRKLRINPSWPMQVILDEQQYAKYLEDWRLRGTKDGLTDLNRNNKNWRLRAEGYLWNSLLLKRNIWNSLCKKKKAFTLVCSFAGFHGWLVFVDLGTWGLWGAGTSWQKVLGLQGPFHSWLGTKEGGEDEIRMPWFPVRTCFQQTKAPPWARQPLKPATCWGQSLWGQLREKLQSKVQHILQEGKWKTNQAGFQTCLLVGGVWAH